MGIEVTSSCGGGESTCFGSDASSSSAPVAWTELSTSLEMGFPALELKSSSFSSSSPNTKTSWSLTSPLKFTTGDGKGVFNAEPVPEAEEVEVEARRLTATRHARHGSYLASRGLEVIHEGQIGR